jgi:hypothetical protein
MSTFHSSSTAVPTEITDKIIQYVIADSQPLPLGGGVTARKAHHPVASVSQTLRSIYLNRLHHTLDKTKRRAKHQFKIGETLEFSDLGTMAAFFRDGPGQDNATLQGIRFLSISYLDNDTLTSRWEWTTKYAYEAFELLHNNWHLMQVRLLQLCLPFYRTISSVNDPGLWSLLKIRNLDQLTILGPYGCIAPQVRSWFKARTHKKKLFPWHPLGMENPGRKSWTNLDNFEGNSL